MNKGIINKIIPFSNVDGPGNRMAIFFQGCNLTCLYCHNPETQKYCMHCSMCVTHCSYDALQIIKGKVLWNDNKCQNCGECINNCLSFSSPKVKEMMVQEIVEYALNAKPYIRGITISGGEPTAQKEFLLELVTELKKHNFHILIDSNGTFDMEDPIIKSIIKLIDGIMLDIKLWNNFEHKLLTGIENKLIIENFKRLLKINKLFEVRTVVYESDVYHSLKTVEKIMQIISSYDVQYKIIKYRHFGVIAKYQKYFKVPSKEMLEKISSLIYKYNLKRVKVI